MRVQYYLHLSWVVLGVWTATATQAQTIRAAGKPVRLEVRAAGANSVRITLKPLDYAGSFPATPALNEQYKYAAPVISLTSITQPVNKKVGNLQVAVKGCPFPLLSATRRSM